MDRRLKAPRHLAPVPHGRGRPAENRCAAGEQEAFVCRHCGLTVVTIAAGTRHRNHCPHCLYSLHLDVTVGDRRSLCHGLMEPIALWVRECGELHLVHRCTRCGLIRANRVAGDDDEAALRALAARVLLAQAPSGSPAARTHRAPPGSGG